MATQLHNTKIIIRLYNSQISFKLHSKKDFPMVSVKTIPLYFLIFQFLIAITQCSTTFTERGQLVHFSGTTMGQIRYNVKYYHPKGTNLKISVDSLLQVWNQSLSTYIPGSEISRFNDGDSCFTFQSKYFYPVLNTSKIVYNKTDGAFDPTVGPLVNAWGFGPDKSNSPDSLLIDKLRPLIGFDKIHFNKQKVCKDFPGMKLDFSAIAKGYAVDVVAVFLESKGIQHQLVEIGGELLCKGTKDGNIPWRTAIEDPGVEVYEQKILAVVDITNRAIATSGNYRNYYVHNGKKYGHTIDPGTGYPVQHSLLSASIFANDCMTADAYATAFMVMGVKKSLEVLKNNPKIDAYLIYENETGQLDTYASPGIKDFIKKIHAEE